MPRTIVQSLTAALALIALTALGPSAAPAAFAQGAECLGGERVRNVSAWGLPATTFSPRPAGTLDELKTLFAEYEADLRIVLANAGWEGNPDDLFATVRAAVPGSPTVTERQVPPGAEFEWMAFRRRGRPACVRSIMWSGEQPFKAWNIIVLSNEVEYTFVAPQDCMNLASEKGRRPIPPPTCELEASFDADRDILSVRGRTDGVDLTITAVAVDGKPADLGSLKAGAARSWSYPPTADGRHTFTAVATSASGRQKSECSASVAVERRKPVCSLTTTVDPATNAVALSATGIGNTTITGLTLPDGSAGDIAAVTDKAATTWSFSPAASLPKRPGDYTYTFAAVSRLNDYEDSCSTSATISKAPREPRWIVRGVGAFIDSNREDAFGARVRTDGTQERWHLTLGDGTGFGIAAERMLDRRWGLELDILFASLDVDLMFDLDDRWESDAESLDFKPVSLGLNYHLTPVKRADLYIGVFASHVAYGDATFRALGEIFPARTDNDFGIGAKLGLDVPFGWESPWAVSGSLRYLPTGADMRTPSASFDVDPLIGSLGIAYSF